MSGQFDEVTIGFTVDDGEDLDAVSKENRECCAEGVE
jgi:hypothetical protein